MKKYKSLEERVKINIRKKAKAKIQKKVKKSGLSQIDYMDKLAEVELYTG